MNIFLAKTRRGISCYLSGEVGINNARLWINGGIDLSGFDLSDKEISIFSQSFDLLDSEQFKAAVGVIEDHYDDCIVWVEA